MSWKQALGRGGTALLEVNQSERHIRRGQFVATVQRQGERYWFVVRDMTRERPTIHGFAETVEQAEIQVKQLLNKLEDQVRNEKTDTQEYDPGHLARLMKKAA